MTRSGGMNLVLNPAISTRRVQPRETGTMNILPLAKRIVKRLVREHPVGWGRGETDGGSKPPTSPSRAPRPMVLRRARRRLLTGTLRSGGFYGRDIAVVVLATRNRPVDARDHCG